MLPAQTFSAIKTECSPPSSALRERKIDAICIFMRCLENSLIFGAKHSSPSAVMRGSVCFLFVLFSLTRKLNAQGNSFFCDKSPLLQLYKIIRVAAADESAFISFPPCAHSDLFFHFRNQQYHSAVHCVHPFSAELFSLYLCGFVENEEVKYFAIIRWQTGPLLDVCVL
jgi:hypothetical protein